MKTYFRTRPFFKKAKEGEELAGVITYAKEPWEIQSFGRDFKNQRVEFVKAWRKLLIIDLIVISFRFEWEKPGKTRGGNLCERFFLEHDDRPLCIRNSRVDSLSRVQVDQLMKEVEIRR